MADRLTAKLNNVDIAIRVVRATIQQLSADWDETEEQLSLTEQAVEVNA